MSQVDEEQWYDVSPQEAYAEAERRIAEAEDSGAKHLDLGDLPLYELPPSLSRLQSLEMLALGSWKIGRDSDWEFRSFRPAFQGSDLSPLASLKSLQSLNLKFCESVSDLSPLTELTSLRSLNLGSCSSSDLRPLAGLTSLQSLDLSDCIAVTDLTPLAGLFSLRSLNLSDCIAVSDVTPLAALTSLQSLQLKECMELSDLTPLAGLSSLQSLDVNHCRRVSDLRPLSGLSLLKSLRLDTCSKVSDLTPLVGLSSLHFLELSACKSVSDLTPLVELSSLRSLELKYCGVLRFSPVRHLLDQLDHLVLFGTKFEDLPVELTGGEMFENVIKNVCAHFTDLQAGESDEAEVKVFILGNGRVGKTQLVRSLLDIDFDEDVPSTHGVQCKHRIEHKLAGWNRVRLNFWDFGGQDIYHATHTLFLHGESVFLLLWSPKHESGVFDEGGLTIRNRPLAYWLDYVFTLAGPDVPVLVIQSQCDERPMQQSPQIPIDHDFEYLRPFQFSAKTRLGLEELKGQLRSAVECVLGRFPKRSTIGIGRAKVRNMLRDLLEKDQERAPCDRIHRTLTRAQFDDMCEELNRKQPASISNPSALLDFLHQSGVVYYRPSYFGGQILRLFRRICG